MSNGGNCLYGKSGNGIRSKVFSLHPSAEIAADVIEKLSTQ